MTHLLLLLSLAAAPSAPALQSFSGLPFRPVTGEWAEYQLQHDGQKQKVRIAVVGSEKEIPNAHWLEVEVDKPGQRLRVKLLTVGNPAEPGALRKIVAELGPGMVMEFPVPPEEPDVPLPPAASKPGRPQKVVTPAGTFKAAPVKVQGATSWIADEVPLFGVVKGSSNQGSLLLLAFGTGAESKITGTPQRMGIPLLPGQWQQGGALAPAPKPSQPSAAPKQGGGATP